MATREPRHTSIEGRESPPSFATEGSLTLASAWLAPRRRPQEDQHLSARWDGTTAPEVMLAIQAISKPGFERHFVSSMHPLEVAAIDIDSVRGIVSCKRSLAPSPDGYTA